MLVSYSPNCSSLNAFCPRVYRLTIRATRLTVCAIALSLWMAGSFCSVAVAEGEPAEDFLKRLRAAGYYDTALAYLDRLDQYPGVEGADLYRSGRERS